MRLSRISGLKGEVAKEWRKLHNEELYTLFPSCNIVGVL
jgi:hypothetical protein